MEEKDFYKTLVQRYIAQQLSDNELEVFIYLSRIGKLDEALMAAMDTEIELINTPAPQPKSRRLWYQIAAAASIFLVLSIGIFFFINNNKTGSQINKDIDPGGYKAVLTLDNGKKIALTDVANGKLAEQDGITITKTKEGQLVYRIKAEGTEQTHVTPLFNTISTPKGGRFQVDLPDGTKVWLNAASSIKFPISFAHLSSRKVELTGEAYFEVAKNKSIPFFVNTNQQEIKVLGTHFNVNSYSNEPEAKTTLLEGSVQVNLLSGNKKPYMLKPGEQATLNNGQLSVNVVDVATEVAWKDGQFNFEEKDIYSIMRQIERWYDIEVIYKGNLDKETFGGKISINRPLKKILNLLESTGKVHFKIEGRRITVMQ